MVTTTEADDVVADIKNESDTSEIKQDSNEYDVLEEEIAYAEPSEDFGLHAEELLRLRELLTSPFNARLRGRLRWILSLDKKDREEILKNLEIEILYLQNKDRYNSREEFLNIFNNKGLDK